MNKARQYIRGEARKKPGVVPPGALRLAEAMNVYQSMRANIMGLQFWKDGDAFSGGGRRSDAEKIFEDLSVTGEDDDDAPKASTRSRRPAEDDDDDIA